MWQRLLPLFVFVAPVSAQQFSDQIIIDDDCGGVIESELVDFDSDGLTDILAASSPTMWYQRRPDGTFFDGQWLKSGRADYIDSGDLDADGDVDCVVKYGRYIEWIESDNGNFTSHTLHDMQEIYPAEVIVVDIDLDGDLDIAFATDGNDTVGWIENLGSGSFAGATIIASNQTNVQGIQAGNLIGGQRPELVVTGGTGGLRVYYWDTSSTSWQYTRIETNREAPGKVALADIDGDRKVDIISVIPSGLYWNKNLGSGNFSNGATLVQGSYTDVVAFDVDVDGDVDLTYSSLGSGGIWWAPNDGNGNFSAPQQVSITTVSAHLSAGDLDGDGDLDLVSAERAADRLAWYQNIAAQDLDRDDDGLEDSFEASILGTDPELFDTDGDGMGDGLELGMTLSDIGPYTDRVVFRPDADPSTTTDPLNADSDGGGMSDGQEDFNLDGAYQYGEFDPNQTGDDRFRLNVPQLIPGTTASITVGDARPGSTGALFYSLAGPGPTPTAYGFTFDLSAPFVRHQIIYLSGGNGTFSLDVPPQAPPGLSVWMQAVEKLYYADAYRTSDAWAGVIQ